ncbi:MAG: hypothetical protein ACOCZ5_02070 [bacterium]
MAIYTKAQLEDRNINTYFPNENKEITALTARSFNKDFIDSIYNYVNNSEADLGDLSIWDDTKLGYQTLDNYINFNDQGEITINSNNLIRLNVAVGDGVRVPASYTVAASNDLTDKKYVDEAITDIGDGVYVRKTGNYNENVTGIKNFQDTIKLDNKYNFKVNTGTDALIEINRSSTTPIQVLNLQPAGIANGTDFVNKDSESTLALNRQSADGNHYEIVDIFNNGYSDSDYYGIRHISGGNGQRRKFTVDSVDQNETGWANQYKIYMQINPNGNMSVGKEPSTFKLDVDGTGLFRENLTTYGFMGVGEEPSVNLHVTNYSSAAYARLQGVDDGDNFSAFELRDNDNTSIWQFRNANNKNFAFAHNNGTSWSNPFLITSSGNVGINRAVPNYKLDVDGYINATRLYIDGVRKDSVWDSHIDNVDIHREMNDNIISDISLWSSDKIDSTINNLELIVDNHIDDLTIHREIDDSTISTTNLWSATKINSEILGLATQSSLDNHIDDVSIHRELDDSITTTTNLWSANKIFNELDNINGYITKGGFSTGTGMNLSGTLPNRLVGSGNVTIALDTAYTDGRYAQRSNNLSDLDSASTARTNLGLGSMALQNTSSYYTATTSDARYVEVAGDEMTGDLTMNYAGETRKVVLSDRGLDFYGRSTGGWAMGSVFRLSDGTSLGSSAGGFGGETSLCWFYYGGDNNDAGMYINSDKQVSIGTTSFTEKLSVNGFIRSSSGYKVGTNTVIDSSRNIDGVDGTFTGNAVIGSSTGYKKLEIIDTVTSDDALVRLRNATTTSGRSARQYFKVTTSSSNDNTFSSFIGGERTTNSQDLIFGTATTTSGTPEKTMRLKGDTLHVKGDVILYSTSV